ncbi:hypothetical protein DMENIID0001_057770 [Sergentomyia squamirostris]
MIVCGILVKSPLTALKEKRKCCNVGSMDGVSFEMMTVFLHPEHTGRCGKEILKGAHIHKWCRVYEIFNIIAAEGQAKERDSLEESEDGEMWRKILSIVDEEKVPSKTAIGRMMVGRGSEKSVNCVHTQPQTVGDLVMLELLSSFPTPQNSPESFCDVMVR